MKTAILTAACIFTAVVFSHAAPVNIVNLGPDDAIKMRFDSPEGEQSFDLKYGETSGYFVLPEGVDTLKVKTKGVPNLELPNGKTAHIAVLYAREGKFLWKLLKSDPTKGKWAFKLVNLTGKPLEITTGKGQTLLEEGDVRVVPVKRKMQISVDAAGIERQTSDAPEPCEIFAVFYLSGEETKMIFVSR